MRKYFWLFIPVVLLGCSKGKSDTKYSFKCTSVNHVDPFNYVVKDTIFNNITSNDANYYARTNTGNGWYTTCERL